jgi:hypothetical protein
MTDNIHLTGIKWALIRALLTHKEYMLFSEALVTYLHTLEAMAKTGKYDDWVPATLEDIKALRELFRYKETETHGVN